MNDTNNIPPESLPSSRKLLRSTMIAAAVATLLLVTVVLPAEYGVDPTGVGELLGLEEMGEIKMSLAREAAAVDSAEAALASAAASPAPAPTATAQDTADSAVNSHEISITLRPNEGKEIKLAMREGARVNYSWTTDGGVVNYDAHGDPIGAPREFYHGYGKATGVASDEGVLEAAFDGLHGWFWRNRGSETVTVTLRTNGDYQELREM